MRNICLFSLYLFRSRMYGVEAIIIPAIDEMVLLPVQIYTDKIAKEAEKAQKE
ncbi:MAG: hypothetical protein ACLFQK_05085 [Fibrobacterota bacterium]